MKLKDILARELKVWPDEYVYISHSQEVGFFASMSGGGCMPLRISDHNFVGQKRQTVFRAEWQAAVDALNAPKVVEWDKGSLPPIGSVVEWDGCTFAPEEPKEKDLRVGDQVTIIAHLKDGDFEMAAFTFNPKIHNPARGSIWVNQGAYGCFRPIRTAEQVAAEERDNTAFSLFCSLTQWLPDQKKTWGNMSEIAKKVYLSTIDAGWQKVTK